MSSCDRHNPEKDQTLDEFVISNTPTESFKKICSGDITDLNKFLSDYSEISRMH